jgi:hypothetical protein
MSNPVIRLQPGDVVVVSFGLYNHEGIVSDSWDWTRNEPCVFSATSRRGMVAEEPLSLFRQGRSFTVRPYPSATPRSIVVQRARTMLGRRWSLLFANCEHFVRDAHGLPRISPQVRTWGTAAAVAFVLFSGGE